MKVWEVIENSDAIRFYFFATKKEAMAKRREIIDELGDEYQDHELLVEVEGLDITPTKAGIVSELNYLIARTCFNEG